MARKWIQKAIRHKGALTRQAKQAGLSVPQFTQQVLEHPEHYSPTTVRRARLARTLRRLAARRKRSR